MPLHSKTVTAITPFSGLGFDLTGAALAAREIRLVRRGEEFFPIAPPPVFQRERWGFELMLYLGRETGGS